MAGDNPDIVELEKINDDLRKRIIEQDRELRSTHEKIRFQEAEIADLKHSLARNHADLKSAFKIKRMASRCQHLCANMVESYYNDQRHKECYRFGDINKPCEKVDALLTVAGRTEMHVFPRLCEYVMGRPYCITHSVNMHPLFDQNILEDILNLIEYRFPRFQLVTSELKNTYTEWKRQGWAGQEMVTPIDQYVDDAVRELASSDEDVHIIDDQ